MSEPARPLTSRVDSTVMHPELPHRRHRLVLDLHADSIEDICRALSSLAFDIEQDGLTVRTSGGYSDGYHVELTDYGPTFTHERYIAELDEWRRRREASDA